MKDDLRKAIALAMPYEGKIYFDSETGERAQRRKISSLKIMDMILSDGGWLRLISIKKCEEGYQVELEIDGRRIAALWKKAESHCVTVRIGAEDDLSTM